MDNAGTLTAQSDKKILEQGGAYFVHRAGEMLGAGWLLNGELKLIAAVPGNGEKVMHTLMSLQPEAPLELDVASTNAKAIRLYEKLGFVQTQELCRWHKVF